MIWCLHGAVGMASDWDEFVGRMTEAGHEVRAVDLWRYLQCEALSLEEFGAALCSEVEAVDEAPVLVGYSMGGRLALHALLARPKLWKAAVIVSAHPGLQTERERILRMGSDAEWAGQALVGDWERFLENWNAQTVLSEAGSGLADRGKLLPRRKEVARGFMAWSLGVQRDLRDDLPEIACPVRWVSGAEDEKFTKLAAEVAEGAEQIRHVVVPGAGHRVPWEQADAFGEIVRELVAGL